MNEVGVFNNQCMMGDLCSLLPVDILGVLDSHGMQILAGEPGPVRVVLETPESGEHVNNNGSGQVNHVNATVNHESAPTSATNNARDNVTEAGSSAQLEAPAPVAAAASNSGSGPCVQAVNLAQGIPGEFASTSSRPSSTVASNVSRVSTGLSGGIISQANLMPMVPSTISGTSTSSSINTSGSIMGTDVASISRSPLTSVCCPLGVQLPQTMRAKIVNSEFVDFGQLLEKTEHLGQDDKQYSLAVGQGGTLVWQESKPKRNINSVHTWTSAFLIFSAVYLSVHPQRVHEMLKYAQLVRTATARHKGWGWRSYDIQFRLRQHWQPQRSWATIDGELWHLFVVTSVARPFQIEQGQSGGT